MKEIKSFFTALKFLTIIPFPKREEGPEELGRSMAYFSLAGLLLGLLLAALNTALQIFLPPLAVAVIVVWAWAFIGGFLHLEGFTDAADGFSAGPDKDKILMVMKDHHCGAKGVTALVFLVIAKVVFFNGVPLPFKSAALIFVPAAARWVMVCLASLSNYARDTEGFGKAFVENTGARELWVASVILAAAGIILLRFNFFFLFLPLAAITVLSVFYLKKKLGGVTGDVLGAASELAEVFCLGMFLLIR
ncbi:MAG: adenosylcobinamide-GDP ribazoletransferase [Candidatus Omnitrophica bacterium]|nr:adenosylcobinamide-GDP ribazoletransferase [Candidatus Omnitrophota bacterium]